MRNRGSVLVGFRGPQCQDRYSLNALSVLLDYLSDTSIAPLQRELVEISDPFCSDISCDVLEFSRSCFVIKAENVPFEKLSAAKEKIREVLQNLADGKEALDMKRMAVVVHRKILDVKNRFENHPHDTFADALVADFLYSSKPEDLQTALSIVQDLEKLSREPVGFWLAFFRTYCTSAACVVVSLNFRFFPNIGLSLISYCSIKGLLVREVLRIKKMITQVKFSC